MITGGVRPEHGPGNAVLRWHLRLFDLLCHFGATCLARRWADLESVLKYVPWVLEFHNNVMRSTKRLLMRRRDLYSAKGSSCRRWGV